MTFEVPKINQTEICKQILKRPEMANITKTNSTGINITSMDQLYPAGAYINGMPVPAICTTQGLSTAKEPTESEKLAKDFKTYVFQKDDYSLTDVVSYATKVEKMYEGMEQKDIVKLIKDFNDIKPQTKLKPGDKIYLPPKDFDMNNKSKVEKKDIPFDKYTVKVGRNTTFSGIVGYAHSIGLYKGKSEAEITNLIRDYTGIKATDPKLPNEVKLPPDPDNPQIKGKGVK